MESELSGFIEEVAEFVVDTNQELSPTKSVCTASTTELGKALCERLEKKGIHIQFRRKVKALGVGLESRKTQKCCGDARQIARVQSQAPEDATSEEGRCVNG